MENHCYTQLDQFYSDVDQVQKIAQPLKEVDILGMFYHRIYLDGTTINLTSNVEWTELYFDKLLSNQYSENDVLNQCFGKEKFNLWALDPNNQVWRDASYFGYGNGISIFQDFADYREHIGFYADINNTAINNYYINNLDTLNQLQTYFRTQAANLINQAEHIRVQMACQAYDKHRQVLTQRLTQRNPINSNAFLSQIKSAPESLLLKNERTRLPVQLSPQRSQCLSLLIQGYSAKQIAKKMKLSPRTIEYYINLLKNELNCRSSKELIATYADQIL